MTADPRPYNRAPAPRSAREVAVHGQRAGLTFDESCARREQGWRLRQGPEPSSYLTPNGGPLLRYGPYA